MNTFILEALVIAALGIPLWGALRVFVAAMALYRRRIAVLHTLQLNPDTPGPDPASPLPASVVLPKK